MKTRVLWLVVALAVFTVAVVFLFRPEKPAPARDSKIAAPLPGKSKGEVAIEDGKTIDFSSGAPIVKDDEKQKTVIEKSLKEMDEATQGVTFSSPGANKDAKPK